MNTTSLRKVGAYVRRTDPDMFRHITRVIGDKTSIAVGAYVEMTDPDMFDQIAAR